MKIPPKIKRGLKKEFRSKKVHKEIPSKKVIWNFKVGELVSFSHRGRIVFGMILEKESNKFCVSFEDGCLWISPNKLGKITKKGE